MAPPDFGQAFVEGIESENGVEPSVKWAHIDIAGTMDVSNTAFRVESANLFCQETREGPYQSAGMTGRCVR